MFYNDLSYIYGFENDLDHRVSKVFFLMLHLEIQLRLCKKVISLKISKPVGNQVPKLVAGHHSSKSYYK